MKTIIKKRPASQYLENGTFTINQREFDLINDKKANTVIEVYDQTNELVHKITKSKYPKLVCSARTAFNDHGEATGQYFVVDFSEAV